jgi:septum formation protein
VISARRLSLASRSPQRRAILAQLGFDFAVVESSYREHDLPGTPAEVALAHAWGKAGGAPAAELVLGVDTVVDVDGVLLGKPADEAEAAAMLRQLAGRSHAVHSGICLLSGGVPRQRLATTEVSFRPLSDSDLAWYLATEEWRDRAGGYAVQGRGAALVTRIAGDYTNVVGLPVAALLDLLGAAGETVHC